MTQANNSLLDKSMRSWLLISAVVIGLDAVSKQWVKSVLAYGQHIVVTPFFDLVLFYNKGAAFSFLADAGGWQRTMFSAFALGASAVILYLLRKHAREPLFCFALSLILGGALGNLWDRLMLGQVVDFLYFHYQQHGFPAFNVADSAISVGVVFLLWDSLNKPTHD